MSDPVTYTLADGVATIVLDDGKVNVQSITTLTELHEAFSQAERDGAVVVLTGREGCFSAGFDLKVFRDQPERLGEMLTLGATLYERMLSFPTPVLASCTGHALAGGAFLLLAADTRISADGPFQFGLTEVKIGLTMPWFGVEIARYRLSPAHVDQAVICSASYSPAQAVEAGFLDRVVPAGELGAATAAAAAELSALNMEAHAATKLRLRGDALSAIRAGIERELTPA